MDTHFTLQDMSSEAESIAEHVHHLCRFKGLDVDSSLLNEILDSEYLDADSRLPEALEALKTTNPKDVEKWLFNSAAAAYRSL